MRTEFLEEPDLHMGFGERRGTVSRWWRLQPFEHSHPRSSMLGGEDRIGMNQLCFRDCCLDKGEQITLNIRPDRTAEVSQFPFGGYQDATLIQPAMGVLEQLIKGKGFDGILSHPRFQSCPVSRSDRCHAEIFADPDLMLVQRLIALIKCAKGRDSRGGQAEPLANVAQ